MSSSRPASCFRGRVRTVGSSGRVFCSTSARALARSRSRIAFRPPALLTSSTSASMSMVVTAAWCVSGRGCAPPSDTPRGLFPTPLMSTGTKTGEGSGRRVIDQAQNGGYAAGASPCQEGRGCRRRGRRSVVVTGWASNSQSLGAVSSVLTLLRLDTTHQAWIRAFQR